MVSNEGTTLKFFGKDYGQSVSVYDLNGELVAKRVIRNGMTELPIPMARGYLKEVLIDINSYLRIVNFASIDFSNWPTLSMYGSISSLEVLNAQL